MKSSIYVAKCFNCEIQSLDNIVKVEMKMEVKIR